MSWYTEVVQHDARYHSVSRIADPALLWPPFRAACKAFVTDAIATGHHLLLLETFRSDARQMMLYRTGTTEVQKNDVHLFGVAADYVVMTARGAIDWTPHDYDFYGALAIKHKLIWGRDWAEPQKRHTIVDSVHLQAITLADEKRLVAGWFPPDDYVPSEVG